MPELPDLTVYVEHINQRLKGATLTDIHLASPFLLRTVSPGIPELRGLAFKSCHRMAKQLVFELSDDFYFVIHLMISGRLQWSAAPKKAPKRNGLAAFEFSQGTLVLTEQSKKKRASLRIVAKKTRLLS